MALSLKGCDRLVSRNLKTDLQGLPSRVGLIMLKREGSGEKTQIQGSRQASEDMKGFKNPHKPTQAHFTGQVEPVKAPELERRVNRFLAGEDKGMEKKSCPQVLLPFPTAHLGHMA